jgi:hypothetical protein
MTFRCKESIYTSGCGQELEFYDPGNGAKKFVVEVGSNPLKKHVCPNAKPFQKSPRQQAITESRQITGTTTYPDPFTAQKNQAIQAMHDDKQKSMKEMGDARNATTDRNTEAIKDLAKAYKELAESNRSIATEMALDRAQRQEFHEHFIKEGKKEDENRE